MDDQPKPGPMFSMMRAELRAMSNDKRAETIVDMFKIAAGEWAAMVLEHVEVPPGIPTPPPSDDAKRDQIRELLQVLDVEQRSKFLGALFGQVCQEFAELIADNRGSTH